MMSDLALLKVVVEGLLRDRSSRVQLIDYPKAKSEVWRNFKLVVLDEMRQPLAVCVKCFRTVSYKGREGTGSLHRHTCNRVGGSGHAQRSRNLFVPMVPYPVATRKVLNYGIHTLSDDDKESSDVPVELPPALPRAAPQPQPPMPEERLHEPNGKKLRASHMESRGILDPPLPPLPSSSSSPHHHPQHHPQPPAPAAAPPQPPAQTPAPSLPPQMLCVRWGNYDSNLHQMFTKLLTSEHFVDVTLTCEGRSLRCHKVVLSACSSYFETLLTENPCPHPIIFMKDLQFWEVQALVDFMYKGEVNVPQEKLPSLLRAAESLQVKGLGASGSEKTQQEISSAASGQQQQVTQQQATQQHQQHKQQHGVSVLPAKRKRQEDQQPYRKSSRAEARVPLIESLAREESILPHSASVLEAISDLEQHSDVVIKSEPAEIEVCEDSLTSSHFKDDSIDKEELEMDVPPSPPPPRRPPAPPPSTRHDTAGNTDNSTGYGSPCVSYDSEPGTSGTSHMDRARIRHEEQDVDWDSHCQSDPGSPH